MRKSYHKYCTLLAMLAFISLGGEARAWGDLGHKVICEIAFRLVQPDTQAAINRLMQLDSEFKAFLDSCIYPDHPRIRAAEHFLNLPRDSKGLTSDECPLADACVLTAILYDFKILQGDARRRDRSQRLQTAQATTNEHDQVPDDFVEPDRGVVRAPAPLPLAPERDQNRRFCQGLPY